MPVSIKWDNENRNVLCISYVSPWTADEHQNAVKQFMLLMASTDQTIALIYDFTDGNILPPDALMRFMMGITQPRPKNTGMIVAVGADNMMIKVARILRRVYPTMTNMIVETETLDEARALLIKREP